MATGTTQLHNQAINHLTDTAGKQWNDGTSDFAFILLTDGYTPADADLTYGDISGNECADADYAQQAASTRQITRSGGTTYFDSDPANFGTNVTIAARYLVCVAGTAGSLNSGDVVLFRVDLNDGGTGNVDSQNSDFRVDPDTNGWFSIAQA